MEYKLVPIAELKFADYNPRKIDKEHFERLRLSIREFGVTVPNTVNKHPGRENILIGGHMRTRAAEAEGIKEMPCFFVDLDETKERLLNIALNNPNLAGEWDEQLLAEMIVKLNEEDANVKLTGFDEEQLLALSDGDGPKLNEPSDPLVCARCKQLRMDIEGHEHRANHHVYEGGK